jgi:hypothetical protein
MIISCWILLRLRNVLDKSCRENQKSSLRKSCHLWDKDEKCGTAGQATEDITAHALCMLDTPGYKHTIRICKSYYFSTATMVTGTRLNVTLYLPHLSCFFKKRQSLTLLMAFIYRLEEFITTLSIIKLSHPCQGYDMTIFPCFNVLPKWPSIPFWVVFLDSSSESIESSSCTV